MRLDCKDKSVPNLCYACGVLLSTAAAKVPSSPVPHLLGTNSLPSATEISLVRAATFAVQKEITRIEDHIEQIGKELGRLSGIQVQLKTQLREMREFQASHNLLCLPSPARAFPTELWCEVFRRLPRAGVDANLSFDSYKKDGPWLVSRVCQNWRSIAISIPSLWTDITFILKSRRTASARFGLLEFWLKNSRTLPLTVHIIEEEPGRLPLPAIDPKEPVIRYLVSHSRRWRAVDLVISKSTNTWMSLVCIKGNLPMLQSWSVLWVPTKERSNGVPINLASVAPQLRAIRTNQASWLSVVKLPFHQITTLDLHNSSFPSSATHLEESADIIRVCPNLRSCKLACFIEDPTPSPLTPLAHSHLEILSIIVERFSHATTQHERVGIGPFFDCLTLPSLRELQVLVHSSCPWDHEPFTEFLKRSISLKRLALEADTVEEEHALSYLRLVPALQEVKMSLHPNAGNYIIPELTDQPHLWPSVIENLFCGDELDDRFLISTDPSMFSPGETVLHLNKPLSNPV